MAAWPRLARSTVLCQNPQRHRLPKTAHQRQDPLSAARGLSTGPRTAEGKATHRGRAHWAWARSRAFTEARKQIWADLRAVEARMRADGFI